MKQETPILIITTILFLQMFFFFFIGFSNIIDTTFDLTPHGIENLKLSLFTSGMVMTLFLLFIADKTIKMGNKLLRKNDILSMNSFIFSHAADGIMILDKDFNIKKVNTAVENLIEIARNKMEGMYFKDFLSMFNEGETAETIEKTLKGKGIFRGEIIFFKKTMLLCIRAIESQHTSNYAVVFFTDITEQKTSVEKYKKLSTRDSLTGLYNRSVINDIFTTKESYARRNKKFIAVFIMDLDGFKVANDTYGHKAGDYILTGFSNRIKKVLRESDVLIRYGGDEFLAIVDGEAGGDTMLCVADKILNSVKEPFVWGGSIINIGVSIGISITNEHLHSVDDLIKIADAEMYSVKKAGKNNFSLAHV